MHLPLLLLHYYSLSEKLLAERRRRSSGRTRTELFMLFRGLV
jgi:hypothetical protein